MDKYDVALSFAGANGQYVEDVEAQIKSKKESEQDIVEHLKKLEARMEILEAIKI